MGYDTVAQFTSSTKLIKSNYPEMKIVLRKYEIYLDYLFRRKDNIVEHLALFTFFQAFLRASFFFSSSSLMTNAILSLSFRTIRFFFIKSLYCSGVKHYIRNNLNKLIK